MKCAVVSSSTLFDPVINPGHRIDASFGISLAAVEHGRIDMLRKCFDTLFNRPAYAKIWWTGFRQCKTWDEAEDHLLRVYGIDKDRKARLPKKFHDGMRGLLRLLLSENWHELEAEDKTMQSRIGQLKALLETPT